MPESLPQKPPKSLKRALENLKEDCPRWYDEGVLGELEGMSPEDLDERLTLYFMQNGKSLYSGKPLKIEQLSSPQYQVDHIIPRSYIKDDSFDNKALVLSEENQWKSDSLLIDRNVRQKMAPSWRALHDAGLISDKKFNNLMRSRISDEKIRGFIARQLVETSQVVKLAAMMLRAEYPETSVQPVKAALSANLRSAAHFFKCRDVNDFHHAHDALLACGLGRYIQTIHPGIYDNPIGYAHAVKEAVRRQKEDLSKRGRMLGSSGFIVDGFMRTHVNEETGEVLWDAGAELAQIRSCLDYPNIFVTRMPEETSGAYWNANPSPRVRGNKPAAIPLKKGMDISIYGGYSLSTTAYAYYVLYKYLDARGREKCRLEGVPQTASQRIKNGKGDIELYLRDRLAARGEELTQICRKRILKYQLFEEGGNRFYLTGESEVRNARQAVLSQGELKKINELVQGNGKAGETDKLDSVYLRVAAWAEKSSPRIASVLKLSERAGKFSELTGKEQAEVMQKIASVLSAKDKGIDLRMIGGAANSGVIRYSLPKGRQIDFVDQSITGMFEKRTTIEL